MKQMTFIQAMKDYFGLKTGETPQQFLQEIKALTPEDKLDFNAMLGTVGYEIVASPISAAA